MSLSSINNNNVPFQYTEVNSAQPSKKRMHEEDCPSSFDPLERIGQPNDHIAKHVKQEQSGISLESKSLAALPREILVEIFKFLPLCSRNNVARACKTINGVMQTPGLLQKDLLEFAKKNSSSDRGCLYPSTSIT